VQGAIGVFIVAIFTAFRRPDLGLILAAMIVAPSVTLAWLDFARLKHAVAAYEEERKAVARAQEKGP
jgi:hypothetical protein